MQPKVISSKYWRDTKPPEISLRTLMNSMSADQRGVFNSLLEAERQHILKLIQGRPQPLKRAVDEIFKKKYLNREYSSNELNTYAIVRGWNEKI